MNTFLNAFRKYLLNIGYTRYIANRYVRAVSIFLLWYHSDTKHILPFHIERFCTYLTLKKYHPEKISEYRTSLGIFSTLLKGQTAKRKSYNFSLRKKLHRNDEVSS